MEHRKTEQEKLAKETEKASEAMRKVESIARTLANKSARARKTADEKRYRRTAQGFRQAIVLAEWYELPAWTRHEMRAERCGTLQGRGNERRGVNLTKPVPRQGWRKANSGSR